MDDDLGLTTDIRVLRELDDVTVAAAVTASAEETVEACPVGGALEDWSWKHC